MKHYLKKKWLSFVLLYITLFMPLQAGPTENISAIFEQLNQTSRYLDNITDIKNSRIVTISPRIKRSGSLIGDEIDYSFKIKSAPMIPSFSIKFDDPSGNNDILVVTESIYVYKNNGFKYSTTLTPFKTGVIAFPSFNIFHYHIETVTVNVESILDLSNTVNLKENYRPIQDYSDIILLLMIFFIMALIALLLYRYFKQRIKNIQTITPEKANELWQELYQIFIKEPASGELKQYYFNSSQQLKEYVTKVMGYRIIELTTYEIRELIKHKMISEQEKLIEALEVSEPVKFAKYTPTKDDLSQYQRSARDFLQANKPDLTPQDNNKEEGQNNV